MDDVAVVIPTLNEVESIGQVVSELRRHGVRTIIVADGGSTDGAQAAAEAAGARVVDAGKGYGRACLAGVMATDAPIIVFMDGDGQDDPAYLASLVEPVRAGRFDFVIGSRWRGRRAPGSMALHQILAGLIIGAAIRLLYGVAYSDMCVFRAMRRDRLLTLGMREMTYGWNLEMQLRAARGALRILEIPVSYRRRFAGQSVVSGNLKGSIRAGSQILATFRRFLAEGRSGGERP